MIAVVPVRRGAPPRGAETAIDAAQGRVLVVGEGAAVAADLLDTDVVELSTCEAGSFAPARLAAWLATALASVRGIVLPGSPDGRDLLGRLAARTGRRAVAFCDEVTDEFAATTLHEGRQRLCVPLDGPFVASVVPRRPRGRSAALPAASAVAMSGPEVADAVCVGLDEVAPGEAELTEADRIVAGGLGCGVEALGALAAVASGLGAAMGVTRPVADRGLAPHSRQIGTTGVAVSPSLYLAFGISGAVQHTAAIGSPTHVVAVNTDAACPMMRLADLAVVADAPGTLRALAASLEGEGR